MTGIDELGRSAGRDLRAMGADALSPPPASEIARRSRRRQRRRQGASLVAAAAVAVAAAWQLPGGIGSRIETGPASDTGRATTAPSTAGPDTVPTTAPGTTTATTAPTAVVSPLPGSCTGSVGDSGLTYVVTLPVGWYANEAFEPPADVNASGNAYIGACTMFAPEPVHFWDLDPDFGPASNAAVSLGTSPVGPSGLEEQVASKAADQDTVSTVRESVAGRPAARFEAVSRLDGSRYVQWQVEVDGWVLYISAGEGDGLPYEESVAALDEIVRSLQVRTAG
jgi:hypothetical protein